MVEDLTTIVWLAGLGRWLAYACTLWIGGTVLAELLLTAADVDTRPLGNRLAGRALAAGAQSLPESSPELWEPI